MALILMPTIVALVMNVLANSLILAFGMMAVFAIVRFRNILRDTLDTVYVLSSIVLGMACGSQKFTTALAGCALLVFAMLYLWMSMYGSRHRYDLIVNLHWARPLSELEELKKLLQRHSRSHICASQRSHEGYEGTDLSYRVLLRNPAGVDLLVSELRETDGVSRVTSMQSEDESEL
jgi:Ca2+/Na+ antiporter